MANRLLMSALSPKPAASSRSIHQWLAPLATALTLGGAAWVGTEWFWYFKGGQRQGPPVVAAQQAPDARMLSESLAASSLFGTPRTVVVAQSTANVKLKGVIASGPNGLSAAIVNTGARDEVVEVGKDISPGLILQAVYPTHVLVARGGIVERVDMEEAKGGGAGSLGLAVTRRGAAGGFVPPAQNAPGLIPGVPPGVPQPQGRAPREGGGANAATGRLNMTSAGPTVEDAPPGSLLARIGLQQGDVIKSIGGQPVQPGRDMVRLFRMASSGEVVQGEVLRGGQTISMQIGVPK